MSYYRECLWFQPRSGRAVHVRRGSQERGRAEAEDVPDRSIRSDDVQFFKRGAEV